MQKTPTVGRTVHFHPENQTSTKSKRIKRLTDGGVAAAVVVKVHDDGSLTLNVHVDHIEEPVICVRNVKDYQNRDSGDDFWSWPPIS